MERIASFCVDHTKLLPGMYLSRQDGPDGAIHTWDIRMKRPNQGQYLSPAAAHTLEHLFATTRDLVSMRKASSTSAPWAA